MLGWSIGYTLPRPHRRRTMLPPILRSVGGILSPADAQSARAKPFHPSAPKLCDADDRPRKGAGCRPPPVCEASPQTTPLPPTAIAQNGLGERPIFPAARFVWSIARSNPLPSISPRGLPPRIGRARAAQVVAKVRRENRRLIRAQMGNSRTRYRRLNPHRTTPPGRVRSQPAQPSIRDCLGRRGFRRCCSRAWSKVAPPSITGRHLHLLSERGSQSAAGLGSGL